MRHQNKGFKLGRTHAHRKATLAALSTALIAHKRITTTLAKARALRMHVEPIINRAKSDTTHNRRQAFRSLRSKHAVKELFDDIADKIGERPGGYTRVVKIGQRAGDSAERAIIELVDYNDVRPDGAGASSKSRRTRRSRSRSRTSDQDAPKTTAKSAAKKQAAPAPDEGAVETGDAEVVETAEEEVQETTAETDVETEEVAEEIDTADKTPATEPEVEEAPAAEAEVEAPVAEAEEDEVPVAESEEAADEETEADEEAADEKKED
jgi:large subunit ribosomal protein L17